MKYLIAIAVLFSSFLANAQTCANCSPSADVVGSCSILPPNTYDSNSRYCSGSQFGVTYQGTKITEQCFSSFRQAQDYMRNTPACNEVKYYGNCKILTPNTYDKNSRYCKGSSFGVTYNGYLVNSTCYTTFQDAMNVMYASNYCNMNDSLGECKVLYPNAYDKNSRYCSGQKFGVTYKGYRTQDVCYSSVGEALSELYNQAQ